MWFSLSFMLLFARTSPKDGKYLHTITRGQMWIWQSVSQSVISDLLGIFDSQDQVRGLMSTSEPLILAQWQDAPEDERTSERCLMDAHISIRPDRHTIVHISQLPLRVQRVRRTKLPSNVTPDKMGDMGEGGWVRADSFTCDFPFSFNKTCPHSD